MKALGRALLRIDGAVAAGERALAVALLAVMTAAVFLDALHRILSAREGRLEALLAAILPVGAEGAVRAALAPTLLAAAVFGVLYAALRSLEGRQLSRRAALAGAAAGTVVAAGAGAALVRGLPNGLVWSQQMALAFMLWVGLIGASLATRDRAHIAFELAGRLWPQALRPVVRVLARVAAAAFAALLALLAWRYAAGSYREWADSGGAAGLFEAFRVPRFLVYGFLPVPLAIMAARFAGHGAGGDAAAPPEGGPAPAGKEARPDGGGAAR
jgi:TRAP-type C4-dicarboxylate transport system permease small subunit